MKLGIERLTLGLYRLHPELGHRVAQQLEREGIALSQLPDIRPWLEGGAVTQLQAVVDLEQLADEAVERVLVGLFKLRCLASAQVFKLRAGAQELIPGFVRLGPCGRQLGTELLRGGRMLLYRLRLMRLVGPEPRLGLGFRRQVWTCRRFRRHVDLR